VPHDVQSREERRIHFESDRRASASIHQSSTACRPRERADYPYGFLRAWQRVHSKDRVKAVRRIQIALQQVATADRTARKRKSHPVARFARDVVEFARAVCREKSE